MVWSRRAFSKQTEVVNPTMRELSLEMRSTLGVQRGPWESRPLEHLDLVVRPAPQPCFDQGRRTAASAGDPLFPVGREQQSARQQTVALGGLPSHDVVHQISRTPRRFEQPHQPRISRGSGSLA